MHSGASQKRSENANLEVSGFESLHTILTKGNTLQRRDYTMEKGFGSLGAVNCGKVHSI